MTLEAVAEALDVAERVSDTLARRGIRSAIIGGAAMAVHGYTRATQDVDLATCDVTLATLREVADELRASGLSVELREPDASDPLGGLIRIDVNDDLQVDVVNFGNPFSGVGRRLGAAAFAEPLIPLPGRRLGVIELVPLLLLKLSAGSRFDLRDAAELLSRHPEVDRASLRAASAALRLDRKLERVLRDLEEDPDDGAP